MGDFKRTWIGIGIAACVGMAASAVLGAQPTQQPLEVRDVLAVSSHARMQELATAKVEALAGLLEKATDERSARSVAPAAERAYMEMELLIARLKMLPDPTREEQTALRAGSDRFAAATFALNQQLARISKASAVNMPLRSVTYPLYGHMKLVAASQVNSLVSQLQTLRSQIELYKLQHRDEAPDFRQRGWGQLTGKTNADGAIASADAQFGPYIYSPPRNPINNRSRLLLMRGTPKKDFRNEQGDCGFVYDELSGRLWALDGEGRIFDESAALAALE